MNIFCFRDQKSKEKLEEGQLDIILRDRINRLPVINISNKAKSVDVVMGRGDELRVNELLFLIL